MTRSKKINSSLNTTISSNKKINSSSHYNMVKEAFDNSFEILNLKKKYNSDPNKLQYLLNSYIPKIEDYNREVFPSSTTRFFIKYQKNLKIKKDINNKISPFVKQWVLISHLRILISLFLL